MEPGLHGAKHVPEWRRKSYMDDLKLYKFDKLPPLDRTLSAMWEFGVTGGGDLGERRRVLEREVDVAIPMSEESRWSDPLNEFLQPHHKAWGKQSSISTLDARVLYAFGVVEGHNLEAPSMLGVIFKSVIPMELEVNDYRFTSYLEDRSLGLGFIKLAPSEYADVFTIPYNRSNAVVSGVMRQVDILMVLAGGLLVWLMSGIYFRVDKKLWAILDRRREGGRD